MGAQLFPVNTDVQPAPYSLVVCLEPMGCPRPRATIRGRHASVYMPKEYQEWQESAATRMVEALLRKKGWEWVWLGCRVSVEAVFPRPSPKNRPKGVLPAKWKAGTRYRCRKYDADNVTKAALDAFQVAVRDRMGLDTFDDDCCELGAVDRWVAAIGEIPHLRLFFQPLED